MGLRMFSVNKVQNQIKEKGVITAIQIYTVILHK